MRSSPRASCFLSAYCAYRPIRPRSTSVRPPAIRALDRTRASAAGARPVGVACWRDVAIDVRVVPSRGCAAARNQHVRPECHHCAWNYGRTMRKAAVAAEDGSGRQIE